VQSKKGFTARAKDWTMVYRESFETRKEALVREKAIKTGKVASKSRN
jgi:predicted GIY-YIG superfamily endonuclease